jgi:threonine/homoserine/homoserine lactone efflux protein
LTRIKATACPNRHLGPNPEVMMSLPELGIAVLLLLLTPGPTNSLVLVAGAERGWTGAMRLIPAELAGYFLTVLPLTVVGAALLADHAGLRTGVTLAAGIWVAVLAVKLWRSPEAAVQGRSVGARDLFITTALNPKALIFGLVLLPSPDRLGPSFAIFSAFVVLVAALWAAAGATLRGGDKGQPRALFVLRRLASVWLAAISVMLLARGMGA